MKRLKLLMVFVCVTLVFPMVMRAQTNVFSAYFHFTSAELGNDSYLKMSDVSSYDDWDFNNYCWAMKDSYLRIGNNVYEGQVTTPSLGYSGIASLVIKTTGVDTNTNANYTVSTVIGEEVTQIGSFSLSGKNSRIDALHIDITSPDMKIRIDGKKLELVSVDVIAIGDDYFHESFSNMIANAEFDFNTTETTNLVTHCDNSDGAVITAGIWQSKGCIYFRDLNTPGRYTTPPIAISNGNIAILMFRMAMGNNNQIPKLTLTCSNGTFTPFNSMDFSSTSGQRVLQENLGANKVFKNYFVLVKDITGETQFTFSAVRCYLDDVRVAFLPINLIETVNNTLTIANNLGQCNVTLTRTLGTGYWNTLCLPFDITKASFEEATGANAEIQTLASVNNGVFRFDDIAADATIEAGTPFIVKVSQPVTNPQFRNVVITDTEAKAMPENESYQFVGTYSRVQLEIDKTELFLGTDGKLHYPSSADVSTMKGLRAYFVVPTGAVTTRVNINGEKMDAIDAIDAPEADAVVYDLRGQRHHPDDLQKGVYICDGRKVIVK